MRGVKRKRRDDEESQEDKLRRKLHRALGELRKVVKKAKTFEVQKTLKKLKDARRKDPGSDLTEDLEAEIEMLKHLSYDQLAHSALTTKLKKNKILSVYPLIQTISADLASNLAPPTTPGTIAAKVQSRVLSCKILASEVASTVENLRTFLDASVRPANVEDDPQSSLNIPRGGTTRGEKAPVENSIGQESSETSSNEVTVEMDDGWESGTVSGREETASASVDAHDDVAFEHDSDDGLSGDTTGNKRSRPHGGQGQSEFLPSLSVGFARGDSGSEFSDSETGLVDGIKKNRRGQRARRAIWEKKFGKNANHIKKQQGISKRRLGGSVLSDQGFRKGNSSLRSHPTAARPRAHTHDDHGHVSRPNPPASEGVHRSTRRNGGDLRREQDRPLHPSWEAKKKYKAVGIVPSQGTKIVF